MNQAAPPLTDSDDVFFGLLRDMAFLGPIEILEPMWSPDEARARFQNFNDENAREFFLYKVLCDVQRVGASQTRLFEFLAATPQLNGTFDQIGLHARLAEHSVWQRRLVEMLVCLIGFSQTNEPGYYFHYLLLSEVAELRYEGTNQRQYFGSESAWLRRECDARQGRANTLIAQGRVSRDRCWYMRGNGIETMSGLLRHALLHATPMERRSLGYCYEIGYSDPSEAIHFNALSDAEATLDDLRFVGVQIAFLCAAIITRAQDLLGIVRNTPACELARRAAGVATPNGLGGYFVRGDFVVVWLLNEHYLAQVEEVITSPIGNESYRVRFLVERPHDLDEDRLLSKHIAPFISHAELRERVRANFRAFTSTELRQELETISDEDLDRSMRNAAIEAWNVGLRALVRRWSNR